MSLVKTNEEVELCRAAALATSDAIMEVAKIIKPGVTTLALDKLAETVIRDNGGTPNFKGFEGYPYTLCTSVNDAVVHGFPSHYELKDGDIVSVDCGVYLNGYNGDHCYTFIVGDASAEVIELVKVTKESMYLGIDQAIVGNRTGDIGNAVESYCTRNYNYGVVRELVGHGLGKTMHEEPMVPNYGKKGSGKKLQENMVIAIEPMITLGKRYIYTDNDGWTIKTQDGLAAVHFEHDVVVKRNKPDILSDFNRIELAEKANANLNSSYYVL